MDARAFDHPLSLPRRALVLITATLLMVATMAPAALAADRFAYQESVRLAGGAWIAATETTTTDLTIQVFNLTTSSSESGKAHYREPQLILFYTHTELDPSSGVTTRTEYEGFSAMPGGTFAFDLGLGSASTHLVAELYGYQCIEGGAQGIGECFEIDPLTVDIDLDWSGVGPVYDDASRSQFDDLPFFVFHSKTTSQSRDAVLSGSVSGEGITLGEGTADFGSLLIGTYAEETMSKAAG